MDHKGRAVADAKKLVRERLALVEAAVMTEFTRLVEIGVEARDMEHALRRANYLNDIGSIPITEAHFYHEFDEAIGWTIIENELEYRSRAAAVMSTEVTELAKNLASLYRDLLEEDSVVQCGRLDHDSEALNPKAETYSIKLDDMISAIDYYVDHASVSGLQDYAECDDYCRHLVIPIVEAELGQGLTEGNSVGSQTSLATGSVKDLVMSHLLGQMPVLSGGVSRYDTSAVISLLSAHVQERAQWRLTKVPTLRKKISSLLRPLRHAPSSY